MCECRELWFRASLAWQQVLADKSGHRNILVVAHNAVNQALVATAIGLPPTYFRRLLQNNAATTVLDFQPNGDGPPRVNLDRLNQVGSGCCAAVAALFDTAQELAWLPCAGHYTAHTAKVKVLMHDWTFAGSAVLLNESLS